MEKACQEISDKRIEDLRKEIAKYEENANKCDIHSTNILADTIGADIDFLRYSRVKTTEEQRKEVNSLENQFTKLMNSLTRCRCVRKIEK